VTWSTGCCGTGCGVEGTSLQQYQLPPRRFARSLQLRFPLGRLPC